MPYIVDSFDELSRFIIERIKTGVVYPTEMEIKLWDGVKIIKRDKYNKRTDNCPEELFANNEKELYSRIRELENNEIEFFVAHSEFEKNRVALFWTVEYV